LTIESNDVLFTESHELAELTELDVVINGFSALDFSIKRQRLSLDYFIDFNDLDPPDSRAS
jgi:hypothetical protein